MKLKFCPWCGSSLPMSDFTSARAKYCKVCLVDRKWKQKNDMTLRSLERSISCGAVEAQSWHAGHYWAQGMNSILRFEPLNVHKQCNNCNVWKHGNLLNYRINLVKKIGEDLVDWLDENHGEVKKWEREDVANIIREYKEKIQEYEK